MKVALLAVGLFWLICPPATVPAQTSNGTEVATTSSKSPSGRAESGTENGEPTGGSAKTYEEARALFDAGKIEEAIAALKESIKLRPDDSESQFLLGMAYSQTKSYKEAAESFKRAARYKPDWPDAHFRYGMMSYVLGRRTQSVEAYRKLLQLNSPLANTLYRIIKDEGTPAEIADNVSELSSAKPENTPKPVAQPARLDSTKESEPATASTAKLDAPVQPQVQPVAGPTVAVDENALTSLYRVGVGDVLDIRLLNSTQNRSSLYTVIDGGLIDVPIAGGAIQVAGMTTEEIQTQIANELKRRSVEQNARISVGVRHYASHTVVITGLVVNQGTRVLRREAVPLYVVLAEVQPRLDAARATIMRSGAPAHVVDLNNSEALSFLVRPGDVINVTSRPQEFYYIGGRVNFPGQKSFQPGITLMQAILAAGGLSKSSENTVEISRESENGLLKTTKVSLKEIKSGRTQDPKLLPGDRIEVGS